MASYTTIIGNVAHFTGEDKTIQIQIFQADGVTPQDITGWTLSFTMHKYGDPLTTFFVKTTGGGTIVIPTPLQGICQVIVAAADTTSLNPDQYQFFLERTDPGNDLLPTAGLYTLLRR